MAEDVFLLLHGWGGNKPTHWQEHLYAKLTEAGAKVHYPKMPTPEAPVLAEWQARLRGQLEEIGRQSPDARLHVLAHSLGSVNWIYHAANLGEGGVPVAARVLLVAPPYIVPQV